MKRYIFLLIAFFLINNVLMASVPKARQNDNDTSAKSKDIKRTSSRNASEVVYPTEPDITSSSKIKKIKTSANSMSCKTYEGKIYEHGEAGYSDCMQKIKSDHQGTRNVP